MSSEWGWKETLRNFTLWTPATEAANDAECSPWALPAAGGSTLLFFKDKHHLSFLFLITAWAAKTNYVLDMIIEFPKLLEARLTASRHFITATYSWLRALWNIVCVQFGLERPEEKIVYCLDKEKTSANPSLSLNDKSGGKRSVTSQKNQLLLQASGGSSGLQPRTDEGTATGTFYFTHSSCLTGGSSAPPPPILQSQRIILLTWHAVSFRFSFLSRTCRTSTFSKSEVSPCL